MHSLPKIIFQSITTWLILLAIFLIASYIWLYASHAEVYDFLTPGVPGTVKSVDNTLLSRFYDDRRLAILTSIISSLIISQTSLLISALKK